MNNVTLIVDLGWGSSGKGLLAGYLAKATAPDTIITQWGPNAGHTFVDDDGTRFVHTMVANGVVHRDLKYLLLGPGSIINPGALFRELTEVKNLGYLSGTVVVVHPNAAVVTEKHRTAESTGGLVGIGSTMKGTSEAVIDRLRRPVTGGNTAAECLGDYDETRRLKIVVDDRVYRNAVSGSNNMMIESAQGFGLSIYHGFYPYTTSRDVTPAQIIADCGIPIPTRLSIVGCLRTYPIRVANRYDKDGNQIGSSGPCYPDQREMTWEEVGQTPELTTVTRLPRRIFSWSREQVKQAMYMCRPSSIFLNFANYVTEDELRLRIKEINSLSAAYGISGRVEYLGFGPSVSDVQELRS